MCARLLKITLVRCLVSQQRYAVNYQQSGKTVQEHQNVVEKWTKLARVYLVLFNEIKCLLTWNLVKLTGRLRQIQFTI